MEDPGYQPHLAVPDNKRLRHKHKKPKVNKDLGTFESCNDKYVFKNSRLFQVAMLFVHKPHLILVQPATRVQV